MMLSVVTKTGLNILIEIVCDLKGALSRHKLHDFESNFANACTDIYGLLIQNRISCDAR
jgi:hypothetical protein